jgi:hypothetical protein
LKFAPLYYMVGAIEWGTEGELNLRGALQNNGQVGQNLNFILVVQFFTGRTVAYKTVAEGGFVGTAVTTVKAFDKMNFAINALFNRAKIFTLSFQTGEFPITFFCLFDCFF